MRAGPRFGEGIAIREHVRRSIEITPEHRVVHHRWVAGHARVSRGGEGVGEFYVPG